MIFLLTADWHLREDRPVCRIDDWEKIQEQSVAAIVDIANSFSVPIFIVGDIFHRPRVTPSVMAMLFRQLNRVSVNTFFLAGNHDLPYHSWANADSAAFGVLNEFPHGDISKHAQWSHFGEPIQGDNPKILFRHELIFPSVRDMPPNVNGKTAQQLLDEFPAADYIFVGDYHHSFVYVGKDGRQVINAGCINRQAADMKDYQPVVYIVDTDKKTIRQSILPDADPAAIDTTYLDKQNAREEEIVAFVESIRESKTISLDFTDNVEKAILANKSGILTEETLNVIHELMEA